MTQATCTTTTSSVTPVTKASSGSIKANPSNQAENKTTHIFESFKGGVSSIVKRISGKKLKAKPTWTLPYPKEMITHLFATITPPNDFIACSLTCKSWLTASKSITIGLLAEIYARQSLPSSISIESYKKKIFELKNFFPELSHMQIEAVLRQALKYEHKDFFFRLALCFANPTLSFAHTDQLKNEFEQGKLMLENSLKEATVALADAKKILQEQFKSDFPRITMVSDVDGLSDLNFCGTRDFELAQETCRQIEREYNLALSGTSRLAAFYSELNENITKDNAGERYAEMSKIIM